MKNAVIFIKVLEIISLDSKDYSGYFMRANVYIYQGEYEKADLDCDKSLELISKSEYPFLKNIMTPVLDSMKKAIEKVDAYVKRALCYSVKLNFDSAMKDCNQAIKLDSKSKSAYEQRAKIYSSMQNYKEAISDYTKAIALDPNNKLNPKNEFSYFMRGFCYAQIQDYKQAVEDYNNIKTCLTHLNVRQVFILS